MRELLQAFENGDAGIVEKRLTGILTNTISILDTKARNEGRNDILAYGIAFCKKKCKVAVERLER